MKTMRLKRTQISSFGPDDEDGMALQLKLAHVAPKQIGNATEPQKGHRRLFRSYPAGPADLFQRLNLIMFMNLRRMGVKPWPKQQRHGS